MKIGISVWAFPDDWSLEKIFKVSKSAGFNGVEVALSEEGEINLNFTKEDMQTIKKMAAENQIELYSVASGLYWNYSLTSNDACIRNKAKDIVKNKLILQNGLIAKQLWLFPAVSVLILFRVARL